MHVWFVFYIYYYYYYILKLYTCFTSEKEKTHQK